MKYLRSLMQQSVTACKNQAKLIQQFTLSLLYLLIIHIVALLFFFLFRLVLFTLKSASNLNGNLNCSKELEHYAS